MDNIDRRERRPAAAIPPTPRWVKFSIAAAVLLLVVVAVLHLTGNGFMDHGASAAGSGHPAP